MKKTMALIAFTALLATGCGGHHHKSLLKAHPCSKSNYYMQCAYKAPGQKQTSLTLSNVKYGVDFAWGGGPSGSTGWNFACSYLDYFSSKDWSFSSLHSYTSRGKPACAVWESSATRALSGWSAGYNDAYNGQRELARLGYPHAHIFFAVDFDTSLTPSRNYLSYFWGAQAWEKRVGGSVGAYGGESTVRNLCAAGFKPNWQTLAWSYGRWESTACAPLRQTSINRLWGGYSVDYDSAMAPYFGQVNYAAPPLLPMCYHHRESTSKCAAAKKQVHNYGLAVKSSSAVYHTRNCQVFAQRVGYFSAAIRRSPRSHLTPSHKRALAASQHVYNKRSCAVFAQRVSFFNRLIQKVESSN